MKNNEVKIVVTYSEYDRVTIIAKHTDAGIICQCSNPAVDDETETIVCSHEEFVKLILNGGC